MRAADFARRALALARGERGRGVLGSAQQPDHVGQALVETAIAFPLLLIVALGLVQFALFYHAQNVVTGAVQEGARVAAAEDRTLAEGVAHTEVLLRAGLGPSAGDIAVRGIDGGDAVAIEAQGRLRTIIPWVADATLPLWARAVISKEAFRVGPGG